METVGQGETRRGEGSDKETGRQGDKERGEGSDKAGGRGLSPVNEVKLPFRQLERHRVELLVTQNVRKGKRREIKKHSNAFHFWEAIFLVLGNRHLEMLKGTESERLMGGCVGD
jgi:hypothetical protein